MLLWWWNQPFNCNKSTYFRKIKNIGDIFEILMVTADRYGLLRVDWPAEGSKVEKVNWVALMVEMKLTRSHFQDAGLDVSHICHKKLCINPMHLTIESHATNQERIHCVLQGWCCGARQQAGADPGIYVRGGAPWIGEGSGDRQGPQRVQVSARWGRSPPAAHEN